MHLLGLHKLTTLRSSKHHAQSGSHDPITNGDGPNSAESSFSSPFFTSSTPPLSMNNTSPSQWVSSLSYLLQARTIPASKLQQQASSGTPITTERMHRDLVEWSARVAADDRELKTILQSLKAKGVNLEEVLMAVETEENGQVVVCLWDAL
jgi:hypothetical protein